MSDEKARLAAILEIYRRDLFTQCDGCDDDEPDQCVVCRIASLANVKVKDWKRFAPPKAVSR